MKKSQFLIIIFVLFPLLCNSCNTIGPNFFGKSVELKATWDPNTETDISHYNFYQVYQGDYKRINKGPIRHPTTTYAFILKVADDFDEPLCFVVTAVDTSGKESDYSGTVCIDK